MKFRDQVGDSARELRRNWEAMLGSVLGMSVGVIGLTSPTNGLFFDRLADEFGWSLQALSTIFFLAHSLSAAVAAPLFGAMIDRFGARIIAAIGYLAFLISLIALSFLDGNIVVYIGWIAFISLVGSACSSVVFARVVTGAFVRARGLSLGLLSVGTGVTGVILPPVIALIMTSYGWREAYRFLALVVILGVPIVMWLLTRAERKRPGRAAGASSPRHTWSAFGPLLRNRTMLHMMLALVLMALGLNGYLIHLVPLLTGGGFSLVDAALAQSLFFGSVIAGRIFVGMAMDRYFAPWVCAATLVLAAAGMGLLVLGGTEFAYIAVITWGFAYGSETDYLAYISSRYFGVASFGRAYGVLFAVGILANGLSPVVIAWLSQNGAAYTTALMVSIALLLASTLLLLVAPRFPSDPDPEDSHPTADG